MKNNIAKNSSLITGCATGRLHKNLAKRSISPDSSKVSHTVATWLAVKFNVGKANKGLGASIGWCGWLWKWWWWWWLPGWWLLKWCGWIGGELFKCWLLLLFVLLSLLLLFCPRFVIIMCGGGETDEFGDVEFNNVTDSWMCDCWGDNDRRMAVGITIPRLFGPTTAISMSFEFGAIFNKFSNNFFR